MSLTTKLYGVRKGGGAHGDVFTSSMIAKFMLDFIGYKSIYNLSKYKILEPSFGNGEFLIEIQRRIILSSQKFHFDATTIMNNNVFGCEIDKDKYHKCVSCLKDKMPGFNPINLKIEDFLYSKWDTTFNFIIGNPPYIRYENIPDNLRESYKKVFKTFHYRPDLYVLFFEHSLNLLDENGKHCFICSNRWLKNIYGKKLRRLISLNYNLETIIDIENLDVFKASVLAYPAITLISKSDKPRITQLASVKNLYDLSLPLKFKKGRIEDLEDWSDLFASISYEGLSSIEEQGFKIGIGVATGADKIFISNNMKDYAEHELLLPIINAKDLTGDRFNWNGAFLLNPYNLDGSLIDLNSFPKTKSYLESFKSKLGARHIVKNGKVWYSLIDKINPILLSKPKILLPDISGNNVIFIDKGHFYPSHNIYYITGNIDQLYLLAPILMSDFVKTQISNIANKMNGSLPRWQSQSLKKLRIPNLNTISIENKNRLNNAYKELDINGINKCMDSILNNYVAKTIPKKHVQLTLFD